MKKDAIVLRNLIVEKLDPEEQDQFLEASAELMKQADLSLVPAVFFRSLLLDANYGAANSKSDDVRKVGVALAALCERKAAGDRPGWEEWQVAAEAAYEVSARHTAMANGLISQPGGSSQLSLALEPSQREKAASKTAAPAACFAGYVAELQASGSPKAPFDLSFALSYWAMGHDLNRLQKAQAMGKIFLSALEWCRKR